MLSLEVEAREERRIAASLKISGLPKGMRLETFDYLFQPSVEKSQIDTLATCDFVRRHENVLFFGPPGVGKTHLAVGLGVRAIELGWSVIYYTVEELLQQLKRRADIPVAKQRGRAYVKTALCVVDELGYQSRPARDASFLSVCLSPVHERQLYYHLEPFGQGLGPDLLPGRDGHNGNP